MEHEYYMPSASGLGDVYVKQWAPDGEIRAIVQIVHGMAEHIARYQAFAEFLNANGVLAVGLDLTGHGKSVGTNGVKGYLADEDGWGKAVADISALLKKTRAEHPGITYVLFGHSMGSFLVRTYAARPGAEADAYILSGTAGRNPALAAAKLIAKYEIKKHGARAQSATLNTLSFGAYNKAFAPNRTEFDWLSRDNEQVDRYVADENCGFVFTAGGFKDLFEGISEIGAKDWAARVPKKPILIISGEKDPVGGNGKGVKEIAASLADTGHDVTLKLYPNCRHELLNETNAGEVRGDILNFIEGI
ncbi:MAG: lysophospholipase [Clostridiaceae bacterium]|nr:alpha/beta hydrolase [Eubacteriales bacterium]